MQYSRISKIADRLSGGIVLTVLFYSNLSHGAARPFSLFLTHALIVLGIFLQIPLIFSKKNYLCDFPSFFLIPASIFFAFLLLIVTQCFYGSRVLETGVGTVNLYATFSSFIQLLCYFFFFILCVRFASQPQNVEKFIFGMAILVFGVTIWGITERFMGRQLFGPQNLRQDSFGPFVNPNHYGAFVGLSLPLLVAYFYDRCRQMQTFEFPRRHFFRSLAMTLDSGIFFLIFLIALQLAGCFLSGSRVAAILLLSSFLFYWILLSLRRRFKFFGVAGLVILAASFLVVQSVGLETTLRTFGFDSLKAAVAERLQLTKESLGIFFQYPVLGSGLGTYPFISPQVITVMSDSLEWHHAHNDYAELLSEAGALGFFLFISTLAAILFYGLRHFRDYTSSWPRVILIQAAFSIFNIAVLEAVDFPLKIPSLASLFLIQLALFFCAHDKKPSPKPLGSVVRWALALIYLGTAVFLSVWSVKDYQSLRLTHARENRVENLEKAIEWQPINAKQWYELGLAYSDFSKKKAVEAFRMAVDLSPTSARYWFSLGRLEYEEGDRRQGLLSLEKAVAWAPYRSGYLLHLIAVYLKESEESKTAEEKNANLSAVKKLSVKLSRMKIFPSADEQKHWMGGYYRDKFQELILQWNLNGRVAS